MRDGRQIILPCPTNWIRLRCQNKLCKFSIQELSQLVSFIAMPCHFPDIVEKLPRTLYASQRIDGTARGILRDTHEGVNTKWVLQTSPVNAGRTSFTDPTSEYCKVTSSTEACMENSPLNYGWRDAINGGEWLGWGLHLHHSVCIDTWFNSPVMMPGPKKPSVLIEAGSGGGSSFWMGSAWKASSACSRSLRRVGCANFESKFCKALCKQRSIPGHNAFSPIQRRRISMEVIKRTMPAEDIAWGHRQQLL